MSAGTTTDTKTTRPPAACRRRSSRRRVAGAGHRERGDAAALRVVGLGGVDVGAGGDGLLERFEVGVDVLHAGFVAQGGLDALGHVVGFAERHLRRHLEVQ